MAPQQPRGRRVTFPAHPLDARKEKVHAGEAEAGRVAFRGLQNSESLLKVHVSDSGAKKLIEQAMAATGIVVEFCGKFRAQIRMIAFAIFKSKS